MKRTSDITSLLTGCFFASMLCTCAPSLPEKTVAVEPEVRVLEVAKTLMPEGIAIDPATGRAYLGSVPHRKIVRVDLASGATADLIDSARYGYRLGLGMTVDDGRLFAVSSETVDGRSASTIVVVDVANGELLQSYTLADTAASHYMNDIVVGPNDVAYITDTEGHKVFRVQYPDGDLEVFLTDEHLRHPNGITISDDGRTLFVDSYGGGVRCVSLPDGEILNPPHAATSKIGFDGLKFHKGNLYALRNGGKDKTLHGLYRFGLKEDMTDLTEVTPVLTGHPTFYLPTTMAIYENQAYFVTNTQLDQFDEPADTIVGRDTLDPVLLMRYPL